MIPEPVPTQWAEAGTGSFSAFGMCWESEEFPAARVPRKPPGPLGNQMLHLMCLSLRLFSFFFRLQLISLD